MPLELSGPRVTPPLGHLLGSGPGTHTGPRPPSQPWPQGPAYPQGPHTMTTPQPIHKGLQAIALLPFEVDAEGQEGSEGPAQAPVRPIAVKAQLCPSTDCDLGPWLATPKPRKNHR